MTQIVANLERPFDNDGIRVTNAIDYFAYSAPWQTPRV